MKILLLFSLLASLSCNDIDNHPERIEKLRAIGVETEQPAYSFSTADTVNSVSLTFYLLSNQKTDVTSESVSLEINKTLTSPQVTLENITTAYEDYNQLRLIRITATATIPTEDQLVFSKTDNTASISYALIINQGAEQEKVRGNVKIYRPDAIASIAKPTVSITSPLANTAIPAGTINLKAETTNTNDESLRISWFVGDGEIEKRRATEAEWINMTGGVKTMVVTARGLKSWNFAYSVIETTVQ